MVGDSPITDLRPLSVREEEAAIVPGDGSTFVRDDALEQIGGGEEGERGGEGERRLELETRLVVGIVVETLQVEEKVGRKRVEDLSLHHSAERVTGVAEEICGRDSARAYSRSAPPSSTHSTTPRSSSFASPPTTDSDHAPCVRKSGRIVDSEAQRASCTRTVAKWGSESPAYSESNRVCLGRN